jgi:RimJ/RimL family protein N-acetyltransferase
MELQPFTHADIPVLIRWAVSPEFLMQWVGPTFRYPLDRAQLEEHLLLTEGPEPSVLAFKVVDAGDMAGFVELCNIDRENRSATVGRVIIGAERLRGRGAGSWMVGEVVRIGFEDLGLHRIALVVFDFNTAAIRCYEKVGFRIEGRLRDARRMGEGYWTLLSMSLLEAEWRNGLR